MVHLFLTGEVQVGKSTLLRALLERLAFPACGFCTCWAVCGGEERLHLLPWGAERRCAPENAAACRVDRRAQAMSGRFDRLGPPLLLPRKGSRVLVMDELGFLEREEKVFQQAVLGALDGPLPVLGVIKPRQTPFLDAVRAHPRTRAVLVTEENRDALLEKVLLPLWQRENGSLNN